MSDEVQLYYLDPVPPIGGTSSPQSNAVSSDPSQTQGGGPLATTDAQRLASRVESLEKLVSDLKENTIRVGNDTNFNNLDVKNRLTANFGKIGGWDVNAGVLSTPQIRIDANNQEIKSADYETGVKGFKISSALVEAENLIARGTLKGTTFSYDVVNAVGGQLLVSNADTLSSDMTALDASTMIIKGDTTFAVNDILVMRGVASSGIQEEWFRVTAVSGTTLTVTRDLAAQFTANENPSWKAGTPVVKQGSSDGASTYSGGWLRLIGEGTNAPYYSVFSRTGVAYNAYSEVSRLGNLNGIGGFVADTFGIFMGDYASNNYVSYDASSATFNVAKNVNTSAPLYFQAYSPAQADAGAIRANLFIQFSSANQNSPDYIYGFIDGNSRGVTSDRPIYRYSRNGDNTYSYRGVTALVSMSGVNTAYNGVYGICQIGNYVYVSHIQAHVAKITRYDLDLTNAQAFTFTEDGSGFNFAGKLFTDGTNLYISQNYTANDDGNNSTDGDSTNIKKYTLSGTTATYSETFNGGVSGANMFIGDTSSYYVLGDGENGTFYKKNYSGTTEASRASNYLFDTSFNTIEGNAGLCRVSTKYSVISYLNIPQNGTSNDLISKLSFNTLDLP